VTSYRKDGRHYGIIGLDVLCSPRGQVKSINSVLESKVRNTIPDTSITPMFPCNTCTQIRSVFYCRKIVNADILQFQTNAWNMQNNRRCYRMSPAHLSKILSVIAALYPVFWRFDSTWRYRHPVISAAFTRSYAVTTVKHLCLVRFETGYRHCRLVALHQERKVQQEMLPAVTYSLSLYNIGDL